MNGRKLPTDLGRIPLGQRLADLVKRWGLGTRRELVIGGERFSNLLHPPFLHPRGGGLIVLHAAFQLFEAARLRDGLAAQGVGGSGRSGGGEGRRENGSEVTMQGVPSDIHRGHTSSIPGGAEGFKAME